jgi:hypothetical protein
MSQVAAVSHERIMKDYPGLAEAGNTMPEIADVFGLKTQNLTQKVVAIRETLVKRLIQDSAGTDNPQTLESAQALALTVMPKPPRVKRVKSEKDTTAYNDTVAALLASVNATEDGE